MNVTKPMLYNYLKIAHIVSAALLLTSMAYSFFLWTYIQKPRHTTIISPRIQTQTWLFIIPAAIFQLGTGFTMISVHHEELSQLWISGSVIGFIIVIGSWFSFVYFLLLSQQVATKPVQNQPRFALFKRAQSMMLSICGLALLSMIFLMANKVTTF